MIISVTLKALARRLPTEWDLLRPEYLMNGLLLESINASVKNMDCKRFVQGWTVHSELAITNEQVTDLNKE